MSQIEKNEQNTQERIIPKLRFPEFQTTLGWDTFKLNDVSTRILDKVGDKKLMPISITAGVGIVSQEEKFGKNISGKQYKNYLILNKGDFVYNKGNSKKYPQGAIYYLDKWEKVAAPNVFLCFRLKSDQVHGFYQGYFDNNAHGVQLQKYITSGARSDGLLNISADTFFNLSFAIPDPKEQQKIADCLSSIGELIELQEQKLAALKQHKKGLMQQLFPSHNDLQASKQAIVYPKFRFPQFKDCKGWEVVELMNIGYFVKEKIEVLNLNPEDYISTENLLSDYGGVTISNKLPTTEKVTAFQKNDILISNIRPYLKKVWVADKDGGASNDIIVIRAKSNINTSFLSSVIKNDDFINYMMKGAKGLKMPRGDLGLISIFPVSVPSDPKEQQAIADCLSSLDKLISEENEQIGRLKDHKKGLMQQLFPIFRN